MAGSCKNLQDPATGRLSRIKYDLQDKFFARLSKIVLWVPARMTVGRIKQDFAGWFLSKILALINALPGLTKITDKN